MEEHRPRDADEIRPDHPADQRGAEPLGGDRTTADQLTADNEVEEDALKTLRPEDPPA